MDSVYIATSYPPLCRTLCLALFEQITVDLGVLLLQEGSDLIRMLDRIEFARTVPLVTTVITVEEPDHTLTGKEAPIVPVWNIVSVEPLGKSFVTGGCLESSGVVFHGDETKHEGHPRYRQEYFLSWGVSDRNPPLVV